MKKKEARYFLGTKLTLQQYVGGHVMSIYFPTYVVS